MTRRRSTLSTAPMAVTSAGDVLVNACQLTIGNGLSGAIEVARASGLSIFVGVAVPARLRRQLARDVDDALCDVVGRLGRTSLSGGRRR